MNKSLRKRYEVINCAYTMVHVGFKCYYCGDSAQTVDHSPPISYVYAIGTEEALARGLELVKVPCCTECNSVHLGDKPLLTLTDRAKAVYDGIQRRHKRVLGMPNWYDEDLEELGHTLRSKVDDSALVKKWVERRLEYIETVHEECLIEGENDE
jgi:hypothetical protein